MSSAPTFQAADYAVFVIVILACASVGVIQGVIDLIRQRRSGFQSKKGDAAGIGEKNLSVWPASLSIMASVSAAPFVLGIPAEIYYYGTMFMLLVVGYIALPILSHTFFEKWYNMGITSMYEYLEIRFNKHLRSFVTFLFAITMLLYMGVIVYAPALAFSQVSGVDINLCIVLVGIIGILYTALGGLKGVLWVDALQMLMILVGILAVVIRGTIEVGGVEKVWNISDQALRIEFDVTTADLRERHTIWTQLIGGLFFVFVMYCNQAVLQKFLGLPSVTKMHVTAYISMLITVVYVLIFVFAGLIMYAYYAGCDPLITGKISAGDQMVPYFILDLFQDAAGFPGMFTAAVFGATLSSIAGGMNAIAAITLLDVVAPLLKRLKPEAQQDPKRALITFKLLVIFYGLLIIGIAFLTPHLGDSIVQLSLSIVGTFGAPVFTLFVLGVFCPFVESVGAAVGCILSLVLVGWLNIGAIASGATSRRARAAIKPLYWDQCPTPGNPNVTAATAFGIEPFNEASDRSPLDDFYEVSYMWYSLFGFLSTMILAMLISGMLKLVLPGRFTKTTKASSNSIHTANGNKMDSKETLNGDMKANGSCDNPGFVNDESEVIYTKNKVIITRF